VLTCAGSAVIFGIPIEDVLSMPTRRQLPTETRAHGAAAAARTVFGTAMTIITISTRMRGASG
jgi:hypothetical protein